MAKRAEEPPIQENHQKIIFHNGSQKPFFPYKTSKGILSTENLNVPSISEKAFYPRKTSEDYIFFFRGF